MYLELLNFFVNMVIIGDNFLWTLLNTVKSVFKTTWEMGTGWELKVRYFSPLAYSVCENGPEN